MGTVVVLSQTAVEALVAPLVANLTINGSGQLVMSKQNGDVTTVGYVRNHTQLLNLGTDDHTQYALADGTRGNFATAAQGALASGARKNNQAAVAIADPTNDYVERITITNDASDTANWVNRREVKYKDNSGATARNVLVENEYGELRLASAKHNTTPFRIFIEEHHANTTGARDNTVPLIQIMDNRDDRNNIYSVLPTGITKFKSLSMSYVLVLSAAASVPSDTPANTVIVRTTT
jgi:hypothetical protein